MSEAGHIQYADDDIHPVISNGGGVYAVRQRTLSIKAPSLLERRSIKELDVEEYSHEKGNVEDRDVKKKQVRKLPPHCA